MDFVKIEGSFVEGMADNELDHTMVASIAGLAKTMKLAVIGEHVDSLPPSRALRRCGIEYAQGNWPSVCRAAWPGSLIWRRCCRR
ncbi:MAG: EAL domain-containing protein [Xanthomonadales bacterium]|nr:EAL domain-containing protein [Xanthomonadales bacterium]